MPWKTGRLQDRASPEKDLDTGMTQLVLVDFDDTLVETAPAFHGAREALFSFLVENGFSRDEAHTVHYDEVDPELLAEHGMGPFRMAPSFRETYLRLCKRHGSEPDAGIAEACADLGRNFLGHPKIMDGSLEALRSLSLALPTVIFSQAAQEEYQLGRVRDAGVTTIVGDDRILITERKTAESYLDALNHFGVEDPSRATMIGNSLRSDINPALEAGSRALLVEPYEMWHYDKVDPISQDFLRFKTFPEAVAFVLDFGGETKQP